MRWLKLHWQIAPVALLLPLHAVAYNVAPSSITLRPSGNESSAFIRVQNRERKPAAIEIAIQEHRKDLDGNPLNGAPADADFIAYPSQLVMLPGDEANVQLRWIGKTPLAAERTYTLVARELPIPGEKPEEPDTAPGVRVHVTVLMNYEVRVYVTPPGAKPRTVIELSGQRREAQATQIEVVLANQGTAHQTLTNMSLTIAPVDSSGARLVQQAITLTAKDIPGMARHLLAGDRRRLLIPWPDKLPIGPVHVELAE